MNGFCCGFYAVVLESCAKMVGPYHLLSFFSLNILTVNGYGRANSKLFSPDFFSDLNSMKGPQGVAWRQRIMRQLPKLGARIDGEGLEQCPGRILSVMKALGCKNTTNGLELQVRVLQFLYSSFSNTQVYESLLQRNCTLLTGKYAQTCEMILAGAQLYKGASGIMDGISKCYQEQVKATNIGKSHR